MGVTEVIGARIPELKGLVAEFGGTDLRVFGSVARGDANAGSDIDLLVRFRRPVGLLRRIEFRERAEQLLGRPVDVATEANLHWMARSRVLAEAVPL